MEKGRPFLCIQKKGTKAETVGVRTMAPRVGALYGKTVWLL